MQAARLTRWKVKAVATSACSECKVESFILLFLSCVKCFWRRQPAGRPAPCRRKHLALDGGARSRGALTVLGHGLVAVSRDTLSRRRAATPAGAHPPLPCTTV